MMDLNQNKVICPNCQKLRLYGVDHTEEDNNHIVRWYHHYGDFCEDILYAADYESYKGSNYFKSLKDLFGITL